MRAMEQFNEAITFAQSHEIPLPRDLTTDPARWGIHHGDPPPFNRLLGPVHPRGGVSSVIQRRAHQSVLVSAASIRSNEAVVVARWLDGAHTAGFVRLVMQGLRK